MANGHGLPWPATRRRSRGAPSSATIDRSKWEGQTVRLRFAVGQNQAPLRAGVDAIRFEKLP